MANSIASPTGQPRAKGISFVARDIAGAVEDIRAKLGSEAVILDIRRLPARGIGRLWQHPRVEVVACLPDRPEGVANPAPEPAHPPPSSTPAPAPAPAPAANHGPTGSVPRREALQRYARAGAPTEAQAEPSASTDQEPQDPRTVPLTPDRNEVSPLASGWRCAAVLDRLGLLPLHTEQVIERMQKLHGQGRRAPDSLTQELALARAALLQLWRPARGQKGDGPDTPPALHVFVGPPGSGKSTVLCKWLTQNVLTDSKGAQVWRLDGRSANPSEKVSLFGEILGVRVERTWNGRSTPAVTGFIDLPGADFQDTEALQALGESLAHWPEARVHLVLNAAYTVPLLLAQCRAFARLPVHDLILTHLDEETAWSKLWNLVLGTSFPLSHLSAGQNIPGRFSVAQPEALCASLFG